MAKIEMVTTAVADLTETWTFEVPEEAVDAALQMSLDELLSKYPKFECDEYADNERDRVVKTPPKVVL